MRTLNKNKNHLIDLNKIKSLCEAQGMPYAEFGRRIGLPNRESISRRLKNQNAITGDELFLIADQLGVNTDELRLA